MLKVNRQNYLTPPVVEAVVEFRFEGTQPWSAELRDLLQEQLARDYPGKRTNKQQVEIRAIFSGKEVKTSAETLTQIILMPSGDGKKFVGIAENLLSVHVLAPYPGWKEFLNQVQDVLTIYSTTIHPAKFTSIGMRYINRIVVPSEISLSKLFTVLPPKPSSMPPSLAAFHTVIQSHDEYDQTLAVQTLSSIESQESSKFVVLYDLNLMRMLSVKLDSWLPHLEALHERQQAIFEESITDQTRRLFQ